MMVIVIKNCSFLCVYVRRTPWLQLQLQVTTDCISFRLIVALPVVQVNLSSDCVFVDLKITRFHEWVLLRESFRESFPPGQREREREVVWLRVVHLLSFFRLPCIIAYDLRDIIEKISKERYHRKKEKLHDASRSSRTRTQRQLELNFRQDNFACNFLSPRNSPKTRLAVMFTLHHIRASITSSCWSQERTTWQRLLEINRSIKAAAAAALVLTWLTPLTLLACCCQINK